MLLPSKCQRSLNPMQCERKSQRGMTKEAELGRMMYMIITYGDARNKINDQKPLFYGVRVLGLEHVV